MRVVGVSFLIAFFGVLLGTPILVGQSATSAQVSESVLRRVDAHYNHLSSLRTRYTEHYSGMGMDRVETGTLLLKKPGRMKWIYDKPAGKLFVLNSRFGWSYTPGDTQATRIAARKLEDLRSPLRLLLGHTELEKELTHPVVTSLATGYRISGVPKDTTQRLKMITLEVAASGEIETMRLEEQDGSATEFTFSADEENAPVRDSEFTFIPPAGVAVVDGLPPI